MNCRSKHFRLKYLWRAVEKITSLLGKLAKHFEVYLSYYVQEIPERESVCKFESFSALRGVLNPPRVGILLQGPIIDSRFLNQTLRQYERYYPETEICISTWRDEKKLVEVEVKKEIVLENHKPAIAGKANLNFQAFSTLKGIEELRKRECDFILKTRTDQAMLSNFALQRMYSCWQSVGRSDHSRILTTDFNSFLFRPYSANDQLMFSETQTLLEFWQSYVISSQFTTFTYSEDFAEKILLRNYLRHLRIEFLDTIEQSLEIYRDLYTFVDHEDLDLIWKKGSQRSLRSRFPQTNFPSETSFVRRIDWLDLQNDINPFISLYFLVMGRDKVG